VPVEWLTTAATLVFAATTFLLAHVPVVPLLGLVLAVAGACWLTLTSSFNVAAHKAASPWVRGRALAIYLLAFFGGNAAGSAVWGEVARHVGISTALDFAALGLILGLILATRFRLAPAEGLDQRPVQEEPALASAPAPQPRVAADPLPVLGPVLLQIVYRVAPGQVADFARAMVAVREQRRRNGATQWGLFADPGVRGRYLECFAVESGAEYLRLRERVTVSDRRAEEQALAFHRGDGPPVITHYVAEPLPD
jgi:MFS family permease